jgi:hypothetical protein
MIWTKEDPDKTLDFIVAEDVPNEATPTPGNKRNPRST